MPPRTRPPTSAPPSGKWPRFRTSPSANGGSLSDELSSEPAMPIEPDSLSRRSTLRSRLQSVGLPALASVVALWAAFPPLGLSLLVWCAPLGLLRIIDREERPGKAGYFWIWIAGCVFWLAILQGIRLAFWPLVFGWIALSLYLAAYLPLFVGVARIIRHRWHWSLAWSAPVAWTGLELCRSYMVTGFAANGLAHTQVHDPLVLQAADQIGGYGVGFVIMATSVAIYRIVERTWPTGAATSSVRRHKWDVVVPTCLLLVLLGYGYWRLAEGDRLAAHAVPLLRTALIQENTPSMFDANLERLQAAWEMYLSTTSRAIRQHGAVDLVIWPESTFSPGTVGRRSDMHAVPWPEDHTLSRVPPQMAEQGFDRESLRNLVLIYQNEFKAKTQMLLDVISGSLPPQTTGVLEVDDGHAKPHLMVGADTWDFTDEAWHRYNTALLLGPQGQIVSRYEKIHLVMFGEYIPLAWAFGFLGDAFGFSSATAGTEAAVFNVNGVRIAPSICFESTLPQFMSWQLRKLVADREPPDVLVNITNDSWFRGSSILDHHLACDVLVAVELRRPFLIAGNTGLSAWIEGTGRIKQVSPRLESYTIIAEPTRDSRWGLTQLWGDLPAWCLAAICGLALLTSYGGRRRTRQNR